MKVIAILRSAFGAPGDEIDVDEQDPVVAKYLSNGVFREWTEQDGLMPVERPTSAPQSVSRADELAPTQAAFTDPSRITGDYDSHKVEELRQELRARELDDSGLKADLVGRLMGHDASQSRNLQGPAGEVSVDGSTVTGP